MIQEHQLAYFASILPNVESNDIASLFQIAAPKQLKVGDIYINAGETSTKLAYIEEGLMRTYAIKQNGEEATLLLRWEGQFTGSHEGIIQQRSSKFIYQALEDTTLLEVDYSLIDNVLRANPEYEPLRDFLLLQMLSEALDRVESFTLFTPEERYQKLLKENLNIFNRVPNKYIASMLGITPVSLSRIRKRMAVKQAK